MAYSNFTFDKIRKELNLITEDKTGLFSHISEVKTDEYFSKSLKEEIFLSDWQSTQRKPAQKNLTINCSRCICRTWC
jgi:hypothetical protein